LFERAACFSYLRRPGGRDLKNTPAAATFAGARLALGGTGQSALLEPPERDEDRGGRNGPAGGRFQFGDNGRTVRATSEPQECQQHMVLEFTKSASGHVSSGSNLHC
jgi:hypothetical protein